MKKYLILILAITLSLFSFLGCQMSPNEETEQEDPDPEFIGPEWMEPVDAIVLLHYGAAASTSTTKIVQRTARNVLTGEFPMTIIDCTYIPIVGQEDTDIPTETSGPTVDDYFDTYAATEGYENIVIIPICDAEDSPAYLWADNAVTAYASQYNMEIIWVTTILTQFSPTVDMQEYFQQLMTAIWHHESTLQ